MSFLLKASLACLALLALAGCVFLSVGGLGHGEAPNISGVVAGLAACLFAGMGLFLGVVALVVRVMDSVFPPRDDQRFPHS